VRVVLFPDGDDPDSYIRKVGDQRFREHLENHSKDFISFKTDLVAREAAQDPVKKAEAIRDVLQSIAKVPDPIKRQVFLQQTSGTFGIDEQVLITEYNKLVKGAGGKNAPQSAGAAAAPAATPSAPRTQQSPTSFRPLSPEEEAEAAMYGAPPDAFAPQTLDRGAAEEQEPVPDVLQACEREIVRLILLYAPQQLAPEVSVAQYLFGQLEENVFLTPIYADLLHICRTEMEQGRWPDVRTLIQHGRGDIRQLVSDLATEKYELSPNWTTHQIYVPREIDLLQQACDNAVLRLNKCTVQRELATRLDALRQPMDEASLMETLHAIKLLKQMDNQLGGMLGTVIPRSG
jgi:DNA primase